MPEQIPYQLPSIIKTEEVPDINRIRENSIVDSNKEQEENKNDITTIKTQTKVQFKSSLKRNSNENMP